MAKNEKPIWDVRGSVDSDGDGLSDEFEAQILHTDPHQRDTDHDGLNDQREKDFGSNPLRADTDGDGLKDGREVEVGTDPTDRDTDHDGVGDRVEVARSTVRRRDMDKDHDGTPDWIQRARRDTDGDLLTDGEERWLGTDPTSKNTDGDGWDDYDEAIGVVSGDPRVPDLPPRTAPPTGRQGMVDPTTPDPLTATGGIAGDRSLEDDLRGDGVITIDPVDPVGADAPPGPPAVAAAGPYTDGPYTDESLDPGASAVTGEVPVSDGYTDDGTQAPEVSGTDETAVAVAGDPDGGGELNAVYGDTGSGSFTGEDGYGDTDASYTDTGSDESFA